MTEYKCLDCGSDMQYECGLIWNSTLTDCFYKFKCSSCGSKFEHRLTKEEEDELKERGKQRKIECAICGRTDLMLPYLSEYLEHELEYDNAIIICENCKEEAMPKGLHGEKLLWRKIRGKWKLNKRYVNS